MNCSIDSQIVFAYECSGKQNHILFLSLMIWVHLEEFIRPVTNFSWPSRINKCLSFLKINHVTLSVISVAKQKRKQKKMIAFASWRVNIWVTNFLVCYPSIRNIRFGYGKKYAAITLSIRILFLASMKLVFLFVENREWNDIITRLDVYRQKVETKKI